MISVILLLGVLFSLGECGGESSGPAPAKKPVDKFVASCTSFTTNSCGARLSDGGWLNMGQGYLIDPKNEEECHAACVKGAAKAGAGCCQWGPWSADTGPDECHFVLNKGPEKRNSKGQLTYWQKIHKISICTTEDKFALENTETFVIVEGREGQFQSMIEFAFAALGLGAVLYGAGRFCRKQYIATESSMESNYQSTAEL